MGIESTFAARFGASIFLALLIFHAHGNGQATQPGNTTEQMFKVHSVALGAERTILVSKPQGYESETNRYPVLYLLDAETHFQYTAEIVRFLAENDRIPGLLIIGVTSGGSSQRTRDLTTPSHSELDKRFSPEGGGSEAFLNFLSNELMPYVERNYRTRPYKILVGHSLGGLFAVHTLSARPRVFNAYIVIDPSLEWNDGEEVTQAGKYLTGTKELQADFYMTAANDLGSLRPAMRRLTALLEKGSPVDFRWKFEWMREETHGSIPLPSVYLGLEKIFDLWNLTSPVDLFNRGGIEAIEQHFREGNRRYGYDRTMSPFIVSLVVAGLINAGRLDDASAVLLHDTKVYPPPWNQLDALARAYANRNDSEQAIRFYKLSVNENPNNNWARQKLAEYGAAVTSPPSERHP